MGSQPSSVCGVEHRRRGTDVLFGVHGHGRLFGVSHRGRGRTKNRAEDHLLSGDNTAAIAILENPDGPWRTRHLQLRATALRERLKYGSWIIRHLPGVKLVADFLTKIIAVKPSWERFWRFVNHQGSGVPNEEPTQWGLNVVKNNLWEKNITRKDQTRRLILLGQLPRLRWSVCISGEKGGPSGRETSRTSRFPA